MLTSSDAIRMLTPFALHCDARLVQGLDHLVARLTRSEEFGHLLVVKIADHLAEEEAVVPKHP